MHPLDQQLQYALKGEFEEAWQLSEHMERTDPACNRAAFNRGWYLLWKGRFLEGHEYLNRGRLENVFGNVYPPTSAPIWDGSPNKVVILYLEGGLGDQIHGMRFIQDIVRADCKVIVKCSPELAPIVNQLGASAQKVPPFHHAWLPSMSAPFYLDHTEAVGKPYIPRPCDPINGRVGIRWSGNPTFEHEQHRRFPPQLLFDTVEGDVVSLQRDEGHEFKPDWVKSVDLDTWEDTQIAISQCETVITSCTSIAHLAGAMGVNTYIIVPILPYYLWAPPGAETDHYESVTLFRQTQYGDWKAPFEAIVDTFNQEDICDV